MIAYCDENKISYKRRLSELGISPWNFYDAKRKYAPKEEGDNAGEFLQLIPGGSFLPNPIKPSRSRRASRMSLHKETVAVSIDLRTPTGTMLRCMLPSSSSWWTVARPWTLIHVNGWRMSCSGYPGTRTTVKLSGNSCQTSGQSKTTRISLIQHGPTWASCLQLGIKNSVVFNRCLQRTGGTYATLSNRANGSIPSLAAKESKTL